MSRHGFYPNQPVEVVSTQAFFTGSFRRATYLNHTGYIYGRVEYDDLLDPTGNYLVECVSTHTLRPRQPYKLVGGYNVDEDVDVWVDDVWWHGYVSGISKDQYVVEFDLDDNVHRSRRQQMRPRCEFKSGFWQFQSPIRQIGPRVLFPSLSEEFPVGTSVEVIGYEGTDVGTYKEATVVGFEAHNSYLKLRYTGVIGEDNVEEPRDETTHPCVVRPAAPPGMMNSYSIGEEVDVCAVDGYYHGRVVSRSADTYLINYSMHEPGDWAENTELRPHGNWCSANGWSYHPKYNYSY